MRDSGMFVEVVLSRPLPQFLLADPPRSPMQPQRSAISTDGSTYPPTAGKLTGFKSQLLSRAYKQTLPDC